MEYIEFNNSDYPKFQAEGFAAQFTFPFAIKYCIGTGYDIGCCKLEWALPNSIPVDLDLKNNDYDAFNLPDIEVDYIFSSHCLEHLDSWVEGIEYWTTKIRTGGTLYLYLPNFDQQYWRPWNNRKHKHCLEATHITGLLQDHYENIYVSGNDLNNSFTIVATKS